VSLSAESTADGIGVEAAGEATGASWLAIAFMRRLRSPKVTPS
jgi:hypothetical protein